MTPHNSPHICCNFLPVTLLLTFAKVYKKTDFLRPVNKKVKTATIFVVKTRS